MPRPLRAQSCVFLIKEKILVEEIVARGGEHVAVKVPVHMTVVLVIGVRKQGFHSKEGPTHSVRTAVLLV